MSGIHPEMPRTSASRALTTEITAMNNTFLELLINPLAPDHGHVLGLDKQLLESLRALPQQHREELAAAPLLLADFSFRGSQPDRACSYHVADAEVMPAWLARVDAFANRLLATLWHFSRLLRWSP